MEFLIGLLCGLVIALLIVATLTYFRRVIETKLNIIERQIENAGPHPKGMIFIPPDEAEEAREKIIEANRRKGLDTKFEELA